MDFADSLKQLASRAEKLKEQIQTEEATKMSLIVPFFQALGYDVFNPHEFTPEFTADVGIKKGEKVDYAIIIDDKPAILIEAKSCNVALEKHDSQLFRYFATTTARFGILTNGLIYKFYTDLDEANKMDLSPFLELDMLNIKDSIIPEVKKFHHDVFDVDSISSAASELKYSKLIKSYFTEQLGAPADDFVRFMISHAYEGTKTQNVIDKFRPIVKKALNDYISELMNDRIISALKADAEKQTPSASAELAQADVAAPSEDSDASKDNTIVTTAEELEAFYAIKGILRDKIPADKVTYKDTGTYFGVLFDNNSRKWICRLDLSGTKKKLILPDENAKNGVKYDIEGIDSLYAYTAQLIESATKFIS
jgi:predicted type IV restriction endonuclease